MRAAPSFIFATIFASIFAVFAASTPPGIAETQVNSAPASYPAVTDARITAHKFVFTSIEGEPLPLAQFAGRPILVVNTASFCGFTNHYQGLQTLHETYEGNGLVVIGVPSGDFGNQEFNADAKIKDFCEVNYSIAFPLTSKTQVKGDGAHPFYAWAKETFGKDAEPRWNFHKILLNRAGDVAATFDSAVEPTADAVIAAIEMALDLRAVEDEDVATQ
jgi:glutathione peroxidase